MKRPPFTDSSHWRDRPPHGRRGRRMFFRFLVVFGLIVALIIGGMGLLAWMLTNWAGGDQSITALVWIGGVVVLIGVPVAILRVASQAYKSIALPLTEIMEAAEAVSRGDLTARVSEPPRGDFGRLARSFNHMVSELSLADERRRNLTADVAHELRTPLHIIQGNLEGVLDGVYEPTTAHIESTLEETQLLGRLVEDLRVLSLAEGGQLPLRLEQVDVSDILLDVETSFSGQAAAAQLELVVEAEPGVMATADADRLLQVLHNLVTNALRHTPAGGRITLAAAAVDRSQVKIAVRDTGEGIDPADLPYIFDRFWRGDKARSHHSGSTGLGLAIAQQLVQAMNGEMWVESEVGEGTNFFVQLPMTNYQ